METPAEASKDLSRLSAGEMMNLLVTISETPAQIQSLAVEGLKSKLKAGYSNFGLPPDKADQSVNQQLRICAAALDKCIDNHGDVRDSAAQEAALMEIRMSVGPNSHKFQDLVQLPSPDPQKR